MIHKIRIHGFDKELEAEIIEAERVAEKLETLRNKRLTVFRLESKKMLMLKNIKEPTQQTHHLVQAAVLLLGDNESMTEVSLANVTSKVKVKGLLSLDSS